MPTRTNVVAAELAELEARRLQGTLEPHDMPRRHQLMGELMDILADYPVGQERRSSQRYPVVGQVTVAHGKTTTTVHLIDISPTGLAAAGTVLQLAAGDKLKINEVTIGDDTFSLRLSAEVMWARAAKDGLRFGVQVSAQSAEALRPAVQVAFLRYLRQLAESGTDHRLTCKIEQYPHQTVLTMRGEMLETAVLPEPAELHGPLLLDLAQLCRLNSVGVRLFVEFVERAAQHHLLTLARCSIDVMQAVMMFKLPARARVESFFAPYTCRRCGRDEDRLIETIDLARTGKLPSFTCHDGGTIELDDDPRRYLGLLPAGASTD